MLLRPIPTTMNNQVSLEVLHSLTHSFSQRIYLLLPGQIIVLFLKNNLPPKQKIHYHPWYTKTTALKHPDRRSDLLWESSIGEQDDQWTPPSIHIPTACNWETHTIYIAISPSTSTPQVTKTPNRKTTLLLEFQLACSLSSQWWILKNMT